MSLCLGDTEYFFAKSEVIKLCKKMEIKNHKYKKEDKSFVRIENRRAQTRTKKTKAWHKNNETQNKIQNKNREIL